MNYNFKNYEPVQQILYNAHGWQISVLCSYTCAHNYTTLSCRLLNVKIDHAT